MRFKKGDVIGVVLILTLLSLFSVPAYAVPGCFTQPDYVTNHDGQTGCGLIEESIAQQYCIGDTPAETVECMSKYFIPGSSCDIELCRPNPNTWCAGAGDTCQSVTYQAECANRNEWTGLKTDETRLQLPARCVQGCCVCSTPGVCPQNANFGIRIVNQEECQEYCTVTNLLSVRLFQTGIDANTCSNLCQAETPLLNGRITGRVTHNDIPVENVLVQAWAKNARTDALGQYELTNLPSGNTQITATHPLFITAAAGVTLSVQEPAKVKDFQLTRSLTGTVQGLITDTAGAPVKDASVSSGSITVVSEIDGNYKLLGLPYGQHVITVTHPNFESKTAPAALSAASQTTPNSETATVDFSLTQIQQGTLIIEVKDAAAQPVPFAAVSINNNFIGHTSSQGRLQKNMVTNELGIEYTIRITQPEYEAIAPQTITLHNAETKTITFTAAARQKECAFPIKKPVDNFQAQHVPGEEAVSLSWTRPCVEITSYIITRRENVRIETPVTIAVLGVVPGISNPTTFKDTSVVWDRTYEYTIVAVYTDGGVRQSDERKAQITTGDARCEDRYKDGFIEFCSDDLRRRQQCNAQNMIIPAESGGLFNERDCSKLGANYFCSTTGVDTVCRDAGVCSASSLGALPFGLWFAPFGQLGCYGALNADAAGLFPNFCTFDSARSGTIFQQCVSCSQVTSCADYTTEDACSINNCRAGGLNDCYWIETSEQLNTGFCVEQGYKRNDRCSDCASGDSLFSSACTPEVCTALGACFARPDQSECVECIDGQNSCKSFTTQNECIGEGDNPIFIGGIFSKSHDTCSTGRCAWDASEETCFKDGNADGADDCSLLPGSNCETDNEPSRTTISPKIIRIGKPQDSIAFTATGNPNRVYVCIDRNNACTPSRTNPQQSIEYLINSSGDLVASAAMADLGFENVYSSGTKRYYIRFYTEDAFSNVEDIKNGAIEADMEGPEIIIKDPIDIVFGTADSTVVFTIILNEPAQCTDKLIKSGTAAPLATKLSAQRSSSFIAEYKLADSVYSYEIKCVDDFGNEAVEKINDLLVDRDDAITMKKPAPVTKETRFEIEIESTDPSACTLVDTATGIREPLAADTARKLHKSAIRTFAPNIQYTTLKAECIEEGAFGGDVHNEFLIFSIDQAAPKTGIKLIAEDGLIREFATTEWIAYFTSEVAVDFECKDLPLSGTKSAGFGCDKTLYCIDEDDDEEDCTPSEIKAAQTPLTISENTRICYLSNDKESFTEIRKCGTITIDDSFGIKLIKPRYGISKIKEFDLEISTEIPSAQCKWVNAVPIAINFDSIVAARNIFQTINPNQFKIAKFNEKIDVSDGVPREIMVMCKSVNGDSEIISPPQRLLIGYDTTQPQITSAAAQPQTVTEGNTVTLVIQTNEATICKYGDGDAFSQLTGKFDGFDDAFFLNEHQVEIEVDAAQDNKFHTIDVSCINRAEISSAVSEIRYNVDFSSFGTITALQPQGALNSAAVQLHVDTSKTAYCEFGETSGNTIAFVAMASADQRTHTQQRPNIAAGAHNIRIRCEFVDPPVMREGIISFIIDRGVPRITTVDDKNVSCSVKEASFTVEAEDSETKIALYSYEMFEKNNVTVMTAGNSTNNNIKLESVSMDIGSEYLFKVVVRDEAGNPSAAVSSNGFIVVNKSDTRCSRDTVPQLSLTQNTTRAGVTVTMLCRDDIGCTNQRYGTGTASCSPANPYTGPVTVTKDATFCGSASDKAGHNATISKSIDVPDKDKDGITDSFDKCSDSPAAETVDNEGCSSAQVVIDTDKDGLEDKWEFQYEADDCPLNPRERDSDGNGIEDGKEDYDKDGIQNKDEQRGKTHPCLIQIKRNETLDTRITPSPQVEEEESSILNIITIIMGFFLIIGGIAYLLVVKNMKRSPIIEPVSFELPKENEPEPEIQSQEYQPLKEAILNERKERRKKEFERKKKIFDTFSEFGGSR